MRHPGPWTYDNVGCCVVDANGRCVARQVYNDPETRAILTHAAEMWEVVRAIRSGNKFAASTARVLADEINAEIAAEKGDGT